MTATYAPFWDGTWVEPATSISFVGANATPQTDTTTITTNVPAGTTTGDLVLCVVACRGNGVITGPATFTNEGTIASGVGSADAQLCIFSKRLTAGPPANYTVTDTAGVNRWAMGLLVYRGTDPITPVAYQGSASSSGGANAIDIVLYGGYPTPTGTDHWYIPMLSNRGNVNSADQDLGVVTNRISEKTAATDLLVWDSNGGFNPPSSDHYTRMGTADRWAGVQVFLQGTAGAATAFTGWGIPI
jgi:hypothetical protein